MKKHKLHIKLTEASSLFSWAGNENEKTDMLSAPKQLRGGDWDDIDPRHRCARCIRLDPISQHNGLGFRIVSPRLKKD